MNGQLPDFLKLVSNPSSRIDLWERLLRAARVKTVAEIGVWKGDYAKEILERCQFIERYYMIDPWAILPDWNKPLNDNSVNFDDIYQEAVYNTRFAADKITILRGRTKEVIDQIPNDSLDFAYIDGDHTLRGIVIDLIKLFPKIKGGGLIGGDDFTSSPWQHDSRYEPTLVCPFSIYFAEAMNLPIAALAFNQFLLVKQLGASFSFTDTTGAYGDISLNRLPLMSAKSMIKRKAAVLRERLGWK